MRRVLAVAVLFLSAAVLRGAPAEPEQDLQVILATNDGAHAAVHLPLNDAQLTAARHLWVWTAGLPPRKLEGIRTSPTVEEAMAELRRLPARALELRVSGWSRADELPAIRIIAAPAEMWSSVPEDLLPSFVVSNEGRMTINIRDPVRIRVIGEGSGTAWINVSRTVRSLDVQLRRPAADVDLRLRASDGGAVGRVQALVMSRQSSDATPSYQARFASEDQQPIRIPAVPASEVITLFLMTEKTAPTTISGTAAELSRTIRLPPSARLGGKFVDERGRPLSGVRVQAEGWVSPDAPVASRGDAVSDEAGQWAVNNLPRRDVIVRASSPGRSVYRKRVMLEDGDADLGTIVLPKGTTVVLSVVDASGQPLENVKVETDGFTGRTNDEGSVTLTGLSDDDANTVTLTASGFAKRTLHLTPPLPKEEQVILERAFSVRGNVILDGGAPAASATIVVATGRRHRNEIAGPDGTFSLDLDAGEEFELTFESLDAAAVTRREEAGRPGEIRDLGTIGLPSGFSIRGRLTDSAGAPVPGARIWTLRASAGGIVTAWAAGRMVQTTSDRDGSFELRGLPAGPALVRIDAADFARTYQDVVVTEPAPLDLGVIELGRGRTVSVEVNRAAFVARLDLRGNSLDADMLTAPVVEGQARLRHVPPGRFRVTVVNGHTVVCDRRVDVSEAADASVECPPPMTVRGRVLLGGTPAFGGTLTWLQPGQTDALINTRLSPMGAPQQRVYGLGGGIVVAEVRGDGTFETDELRPGDWQVGWRSADSTGTPDRPFTIPDAAQAQIVVDFDGAVVRGRVVDKRGEPVAGARLREIQGTLHAIAGADGSFTLTAVSPGAHRLQASLGARTSRAKDVLVEIGKQVPDVTLEIGDDEQHLLSVRALGADGQPKPHAFVFIELAGGILKTATADENGVATAAVAEGLPAGARLVAYAGNAWAFGEIRGSTDDGPLTATVRFGRTGALRIRSKTVSGSLVVLTPRVPGDLAWMFSRIGLFLSVAPDSPLLIHGLPTGIYEVIVGDARAVASVPEGSTASVELP